MSLDSLQLTGVRVPLYDFAAWRYDPLLRTATWTLQSPLWVDKLFLDISGEPSDTSPVSSPHGLLNGGSDFELRFDALAGDVNQNAAVQLDDFVEVYLRFITRFYDVTADLDGNGVVGLLDVLLQRVLTVLEPTLPPGEPPNPS